MAYLAVYIKANCLLKSTQIILNFFREIWKMITLQFFNAAFKSFKNYSLLKITARKNCEIRLNLSA